MESREMVCVDNGYGNDEDFERLQLDNQNRCEESEGRDVFLHSSTVYYERCRHFCGCIVVLELFDFTWGGEEEERERGGE